MTLNLRGFCQADFKKVQTLEQAFDEQLVTDEVKVLFL
jgi:hypothetical protein